MKSYDELRRVIWEKLFRMSLQRLSSSLFELMPPYAYVQSINESNVHRYLGLQKSEIKSWAIVGGHLGQEVKTILKNYPNCNVTIFECSERYLTRLRKRFQNNSRVEVVGKAVSDSSGRVDFFESSLGESGSLLKVGKLAQSSYGMEQAETFPVDTIRLDDHFQDTPLDVLQIDVQGAELKVLGGAEHVLTRAKAIFTEVSILPDLYVGAATMDELDKVLKAHNYDLILLGTGYNLVGNALYLKSNDYNAQVRLA